MNYGIGNVKGKSSGGGGGGIPVITLEASQMIDQTHIQFTEEQYNTIVANGVINLILMGQTIAMTMQNASQLANVYLYSFSDNNTGVPNAIEVASIELNKTTYIGTLMMNSYEKAKQLYQHNICLNVFGTRYRDAMFITIENDNSNALTKSDILDYLQNFPYDSTKPEYEQTKMCRLDGWSYDGNSSTYIYYRGIQYYNNGIKTYTTSGSGTPNIDNFTIDDVIIPL